MIATAGYIHTGADVTPPSGDRITVTRWEAGPNTGEISVFYALGLGEDRIILDTNTEVTYHGLSAERVARWS